MSNKNINKLLAFTAITGAAIAAGIAYFKHKNSSTFDDDFDDDFDDEDFDFPLPTENDSTSIKREYVSLSRDSDSAKTEETPVAVEAVDSSTEESTDSVEKTVEEKDESTTEESFE